MQQDYEHTEHIQDLIEALARAQANMKNPLMDKANPHFKSRYPSLATIRDAVMPPLTAEGIALTQLPLTSETRVGCVTILWHKDQYLKNTLLLPMTKGDPQAYGSAIAYARRYALLAICNIAGEEDDDDGNAASGQATPPGQHGARGDRAGTGASPASAVQTAPAREAVAARQAEEQRLDRLDEVAQLYQDAIKPLKHAGMHKAIFHHCFDLEKPELIKEQSLETFEAGMALYRHLTAQLVTWDRTVKPDDWIGEQQRRLATQAEASIPEGVDPATGEDYREMPTGWLTAEEQRAQQARDEADLLAHAEQH